MEKLIKVAKDNNVIDKVNMMNFNAMTGIDEDIDEQVVSSITGSSGIGESIDKSLALLKKVIRFKNDKAAKYLLASLVLSRK